MGAFLAVRVIYFERVKGDLLADVRAPDSGVCQGVNQDVRGSKGVNGNV